MPGSRSAGTAKAPYPPAGTRIVGEGEVYSHDVTKYRLHRMCIRVVGKYPDTNVWLHFLKGNELLGRCYAEKTGNSVFIGLLWLYWKDEV